MSTIPCPECNKIISESADSCPKCGFKLTPESVSAQKEKLERGGKVLKYIGIAFGVMIILGMIFGQTNETTGSRAVVVENSQYDASVSQVKVWLKRNANDAGSLEFIEWSPVKKINDGYIVRCKYRGKNQLGALVIENKIFHLDSSGEVQFTTDYQ